MVERPELEVALESPEIIDHDLGLVYQDLKYMPEEVEDFSTGKATDQQITYGSEWSVSAYDRLNSLEHAYRKGAMTGEQEKRYKEIKAMLRELMPLIRRYYLPEPTVPLTD